jgi:ATP-dependent DNA helicase RecG
MPISVAIIDISQLERNKILALCETHFCDLKATLIKPGKLTRTIAALSNGEGGEIYIGIEEDKITRINTWAGFDVPEDANGHLQSSNPSFRWVRDTVTPF